MMDDSEYEEYFFKENAEQEKRQIDLKQALDDIDLEHKISLNRIDEKHKQTIKRLESMSLAELQASN